jgi:hypothetical protein
MPLGLFSERLLRVLPLDKKKGVPAVSFPALPQNVWVAEAAEADMDAASPRSIA